MKKDVKKMLMWVTNTLLGTLIIGLPMIALNVENEIIGLLLILIAGILINAYGIFYLKFSKYVIGEKWYNLKVHQYKDGKVWVESNNVIDNIIDIEVVEHDYRKIL
jgi:hypothetical protein